MFLFYLHYRIIEEFVLCASSDLKQLLMLGLVGQYSDPLQAGCLRNLSSIPIMGKRLNPISKDSRQSLGCLQPVFSGCCGGGSFIWIAVCKCLYKSLHSSPYWLKQDLRICSMVLWLTFTLHMIPDLYFLNESNVFVVAAAAWNVFVGIVFRIWPIVSYIVLILFTYPNRKKSQDVDLGLLWSHAWTLHLAVDRLGNTWCIHSCVSLAKWCGCHILQKVKTAIVILTHDSVHYVSKDKSSSFCGWFPSYQKL